MPLAVSSLRDGTLVDNGPTAGDASGGVAGTSCEGCESCSIVLVPLALSEGGQEVVQSHLIGQGANTRIQAIAKTHDKNKRDYRTSELQ